MARLLHSGETVFHGVASPLPMVATLLAKHLYAPDLTYLNITGAVDSQPERLPVSTVDPALLHGTRALVTLADLFDLSARGRLDVAFLSGVQIDAEGRINLSAIGSYEHPTVRLPGGAGSAMLMPTARRVILWRTKHDRADLRRATRFRHGGRKRRPGCHTARRLRPPRPKAGGREPASRRDRRRRSGRPPGSRSPSDPRRR